MTLTGSTGSQLPIAVRVYPDLKPSQPERKAPQIDGMLVFDCETRRRHLPPTRTRVLLRHNF
jgi:hypothetical protein